MTVSVAECNHCSPEAALLLESIESIQTTKLFKLATELGEIPWTTRMIWGVFYCIYRTSTSVFHLQQNEKWPWWWWENIIGKIKTSWNFPHHFVNMRAFQKIMENVHYEKDTLQNIILEFKVNGIVIFLSWCFKNYSLWPV